MQKSKHGETKNCSFCKTIFPLSEFYKRAISHDGLTSRCKYCIKADIKNRRLKALQADKERFLAKKNERERQRYKTSHTVRIKRKESIQSRFKKLPEARRAYLLVWKALKRGILIKPEFCQRCNKKAELDAHHSNYNEPLNVEWLCRECHASQHKIIELHITPDGTAATWWWTPEADQILSTLGPPAPGFEGINSNPWCG